MRSCLTLVPRLAAAIALLLPAISHAQEPVRKPEPNAEIVSRLQEIVSLRQAEAQRQKALAKDAAGDGGEADVALCRARVALARETGDRAQVREQLQRIVTIYEAIHTRAISMASAKMSTSRPVTELRIKVLQAQIELQREQAASGD